MEGQQIHPQYDREFVSRWFNMLQTFLESTLKGDERCVSFKKPEDLTKMINFEVDDEACTKDELVDECQKVLKHQAKPYHPHFHNQLYGGFDQFSYLGAVTIPSINGSIYTFEMSPCYTLMENSIWEHMRQVIGWEQIDATMAPGGSMSNFFAINLAKHKMFPDIHKTGLCGMPTLKMFTSEVSHYSLRKGAIFTGVGIDNTVMVPVDEFHRMIPEELEKAIQKEIEAGNKPFMVNSTLGSTVEGCIDPLPVIGEICKKYGIWHHVDGALGAAFLMSPKLRATLGSFENVDSITFDPHKALVAPLQAVFFMTKHKESATKCNSLKADYLFHKERASYSGDLDVGDKQLMCGRVIDVVKVWTYFKGNGWKGIAKQVENEHDLALYIKKYVEERPEKYRLVFQNVDTFNVCFFYIPKKLREEGDCNPESESFGLVSKMNVLAKKYMIDDGKMMFGYSKSKTEHYFWRQVMLNPFNTYSDIDYEMEHLEKYCEQAFEELTAAKE